jgi:hypothetical protein
MARGVLRDPLLVRAISQHGRDYLIFVAACGNGTPRQYSSICPNPSQIFAFSPQLFPRKYNPSITLVTVYFIFSATKQGGCVSNVLEGARVGGDHMQVERFSIAEMAALRNQLIEGGLDYQQAAELFQMFLTGRGYGVSPESARDAANRVSGAGNSVEAIQRELEGIAKIQ